jgi:PAS domain-containing protein
MNTHLIEEDSYLRTVVDTIPSAIFVVDDGFNIIDLNPAATKLFKLKSDATLHRLCGQVLHCKHAMVSKGGCGTTKVCPECVFRNSVESACMGEKTHKKKYKMNIELDGKYLDLHLLVTTSPFEYEGEKFVLMAIEDITELVTLKRLLPICSRCKKIRNDDGYWEAVADYLRKYADLDFTHSICPECAHKLYPDMDP